MIHDNSSKHEPVSEESFIRVGACGWDLPHWNNSFYPDDLPQDWRLSYYANEFSAVLVPADVWQAEQENLEDWGDEVGQGFRFYLQQAERVASEAELLKVEQALGSCFGGFVELQSTNNQAETINKNTGVGIINLHNKDLRGWGEWLQNNGPSLKAVFLKDPDLSYKQLSDFKSLVELLNL